MLFVLFSFASLIILTAIETSFFASLSPPLVYTPVLFTAAIYAIQHRGSTVGIWWLAGYGLYLDILHIGYSPGETIIYFGAGALAYALSRRMFTNRSLYGIIGCGAITLTAVFLVHFGYHILSSLLHDSNFNLTDNLIYFASRIILFIILTFIIFQVNQSLKKSLALRSTK